MSSYKPATGNIVPQRRDHFANRFNAELATVHDLTPGLRAKAVICCRCGDRAWPRWTPLKPLHRDDVPPLPYAWELYDSGKPQGHVVCADCVSDAIDGAMNAMRRYLETPAGKAALEAEMAA